ncbi:MAG: extracellular solute-binding protein [Lachnospiraceae bacterium]|nr:extracellular solute-binding protein [Lachnospiraceae bacterium]
MSKKIICIAVTICLLLGISGCRENTSDDTLVLAIRDGMYAEAIKKCLPAFEEEHGVKCEIYALSEEDLYSYVLNDSVLKKGSYDLCMVDSSWVAEYVAEDVLTDLGALGCTIDDDIIPETASICIQDGTTYLMPFYGNVTVLMFNEYTASKFNYTKENLDTLEELLDFCQRACKNTNGGFAYRGDTENNVVVDFLPILRAFGGWVVDENNNPTINTEEFEAAMNYYLELIATEMAHPKEEIIKGIEFSSIAAAVGWPGWYKAKENIDLTYIAFPSKVNEDSPSYNCSIYGIWTLGIPQNSTKKELAGELLKYLMDPGIQKETVHAGGVPCRYSVLNDPELNAEKPELSVICRALENGVYRPVMREWPRFYAILGEAMKKIMKGDLTVSEGMLLAQAELEKLMNGE